ncbi:MAG: endonuclease/exonuclease/phosphatase family protein [Acidimicrobiia bacterium]
MDERAGLTVVTWNAQGSHGLDIDAAASSLREFDAQLIMIQEIQRRQVGALRVALRMADARWRFKHWPVKVPAEGLGILSTQPLAEVRTAVLAHRWSLWNWRRRVAVECSVELGPRRVRFVDVHLGAGVPVAERVRQAHLLITRANGAVVIAGDLNAGPGSEELRAFAARGWTDAERGLHPGTPTPATNWPPGPRVSPPTQRLDYVLARDTVEVVEAFVPTDWEPWAALSDHLPVVTHLRV